MSSFFISYVNSTRLATRNETIELGVQFLSILSLVRFARQKKRHCRDSKRQPPDLIHDKLDPTTTVSCQYLPCFCFLATVPKMLLLCKKIVIQLKISTFRFN